MEYVVIGLFAGLVAFNMWLTERRENRWHKRLDDLLNRKMAKDFYDYVNGMEILDKSKNPQQQLFKEVEQQIKDKADTGKVPPFINERRPYVHREY